MIKKQNAYEDEPYFHYLDGRNKFYEEMNKLEFTDRQTFISLRMCGAGPDPFDFLYLAKKTIYRISKLSQT